MGLPGKELLLFKKIWNVCGHDLGFKVVEILHWLLSNGDIRSGVISSAILW